MSTPSIYTTRDGKSFTNKKEYERRLQLLEYQDNSFQVPAEVQYNGLWFTLILFKTKEAYQYYMKNLNGYDPDWCHLMLNDGSNSIWSNDLGIL